MLRIRKATDISAQAWVDILPGEVGRGLHEDTDYLLELGIKAESRIFIDDVELTKETSGFFKWRPSFYAGRVTVDLLASDAQVARHQYFLDVSPSPSKSGKAEFDEMVSDIRAFDQALLGGVSSASMEFGHGATPGRFGLDILLSRLRTHGPAFLSVVETIASSPHRSLTAEARLLPLSRIRRLHHSSLLDRRLAALAVGLSPGADALDTLQLNSQTSAPTFDTPANRALLALLRRFRAAVSSMQDSVKGLKLGSPPEEQSLRVERRLEDLGMLEARARKFLLGPLFSEVTRAEATAAGLTQVATQPTYSRAYRLGSRALSIDIDGDDSSDQLHVAPSWGIYETWCFIQTVEVVAKVTQARGTEGRSSAVAAERCVSFTLDDGSALEVLFQATFPALEPPSKRIGWSLSRERRPDIILVHRTEGQSRAFVLDAKWRSGRDNVLDAMQSAHIYHDALRIGGNAPMFALLLLPGACTVRKLEEAHFVQANAVGTISDVRVHSIGTTALSEQLRSWLSPDR